MMPVPLKFEVDFKFSLEESCNSCCVPAKKHHHHHGHHTNSEKVDKTIEKIEKVLKKDKEKWGCL